MQYHYSLILGFLASQSGAGGTFLPISLGIDLDDLIVLVLLDLDNNFLVERNIEQHLHLPDLLGIMGGLQQYLLDPVDDGHQVILEHVRVDRPFALVRRAVALHHRLLVELAHAVLAAGSVGGLLLVDVVDRIEGLPQHALHERVRVYVLQGALGTHRIAWERKEEVGQFGLLRREVLAVVGEVAMEGDHEGPVVVEFFLAEPDRIEENADLEL